MNNSRAVEILNKIEPLPCGYCYQGGHEFEEAVALAIHVLNTHESLEKKIEYLTKERPKGEWKKDNMTGILDCALCGMQAPIDITSGEFSESPYCPWCGADMRGEDV